LDDPKQTREQVTLGVDTHAEQHVAVALDERGRLLGTYTLDGGYSIEWNDDPANRWRSLFRKLLERIRQIGRDGDRGQLLKRRRT
jgi:hypothetical protein